MTGSFREFKDGEKIDDEDCYIDFYGDRNFVENDSNDDFSVCKKSSPLPFEERIVNFLHATSRDLYLTNKKLEEAAITNEAKSLIREEDSIGRWGGEEFMILLPESSKAEAVEIAEKIRKEINDLQWEKMNPISISLGVAEAVEKDDLTSLYKRVDERLYYAKTHGKNQVVSSDGKD